MEQFSTREQIIETINKLFYYTDYQQWEKLINEVFDKEVYLDMVSMGAEKSVLILSSELCKMWEEGFSELDAIHHQAGNYIVEVNGNSSNVKAYAIASHYKKNASQGTVREFIGSYDFHLVKTGNGWRINKFIYNLKYTDGNMELK